MKVIMNHRLSVSLRLLIFSFAASLALQAEDGRGELAVVRKAPVGSEDVTVDLEGGREITIHLLQFERKAARDVTLRAYVFRDGKTENLGEARASGSELGEGGSVILAVERQESGEQTRYAVRKIGIATRTKRASIQAGTVGVKAARTAFSVSTQARDVSLAEPKKEAGVWLCCWRTPVEENRDFVTGKDKIGPDISSLDRDGAKKLSEDNATLAVVLVTISAE